MEALRSYHLHDNYALDMITVLNGRCKHRGVGQNVPIGRGGVTAIPEDLLVGNGDGVVVPLRTRQTIAKPVDMLVLAPVENFVFDQVSAGERVIGLHRPDAEANQRVVPSVSTRKHQAKTKMPEQ